MVLPWNFTHIAQQLAAHRFGRTERTYIRWNPLSPLKLNPNDAVNCDLLGLRFNGRWTKSNDLRSLISQIGFSASQNVIADTCSVHRTRYGRPRVRLLTFAGAFTGSRCIYLNFGTKIRALLCGERYDKWFSKFLLEPESGMRLGFELSLTLIRRLRPCYTFWKAALKKSLDC